jgi:hypothetical protein
MGANCLGDGRSCSICPLRVTTMRGTGAQLQAVPAAG